jgi:hypothetical protein
MALVLGRLTANLTEFGSAGSQVSAEDFMRDVETNAYVCPKGPNWDPVQLANHRLDPAYGSCIYSLANSWQVHNSTSSILFYPMLTRLV